MESIKVLAVLGKACVNAAWREEFFEDPVPTAQALVGQLDDNEMQQILDLGGKGELPQEWEGNREAFVASVSNGMDGVRTAYVCPHRPCPRG